MTVDELLELTIPDIYYILNYEAKTLTAEEIKALEDRLNVLEKEAEEEELRERYGERPKEFNCPKCDALVSADITECPYCNHVFVDKDYYNTMDNPVHSASNGSSSNAVLYIVAFLIPVIGIVLGLIYIAKDNDTLGKSLLTFSIIVSVIFGIIIALFL